MNRIAMFTIKSNEFDPNLHETAADALEEALNNFIETIVHENEAIIVNIQFSTAINSGSTVVYSAMVWYDIPKPKK